MYRALLPLSARRVLRYASGLLPGSAKKDAGTCSHFLRFFFPEKSARIWPRDVAALSLERRTARVESNNESSQVPPSPKQFIDQLRNIGTIETVKGEILFEKGQVFLSRRRSNQTTATIVRVQLDSSYSLTVLVQSNSLTVRCTRRVPETGGKRKLCRDHPSEEALEIRTDHDGQETQV